MSFYITSCYVLLLFNVPSLGLSYPDPEEYHVTYKFGTTYPFMDWIDKRGYLSFPNYTDDACYDNCGCKSELNAICLCNRTLTCQLNSFKKCINTLLSNYTRCGLPQNTNSYSSCLAALKRVTTLNLDTISLKDIKKHLHIINLNNINNFSISAFFEPLNLDATLNFLSITSNIISLNLISTYNNNNSTNVPMYGRTEGILPKLQYLNIVGTVPSSKLYWIADTKIKHLNLRSWSIFENIDTELFFSSLPKSIQSVDIGSMDDYDEILTRLTKCNITTLGLAESNLKEIPEKIRNISKNIKYLSLNGNHFGGSGKSYAVINKKKKGRKILAMLKFPELPELLELDLRNCEIQYLFKSEFVKMPKLKKLSLGGNKLTYSSNIFNYLNKLNYLDISSNNYHGNRALVGSKQVTFKKYTNHPLVVDLSYSQFTSEYEEGSFLPINTTHVILNNAYVSTIQALKKLSNLQMIYIDNLRQDSHSSESDYKIMISILSNIKNLKELHIVNDGLERSYLIGLLRYLNNLEVLVLQGNNIDFLHVQQFSSLKNLKVVDLSWNSIATWQEHVFVNNYYLKTLNVSSNKISMITNDMIKDFTRVEVLDISNNPLLCSAKLRKLMCIAHNDTNNLTILHSDEKFCLDENSGNATSYETFVAGGLCQLNFTTTKHYKPPMPTTSLPERTTHMSPFDFVGRQLYYSTVYMIIMIFLLITTAISVISLVVFFKWYTISYYLTLIKLTKGAILFKKPKQARKCMYDVFVSYSENDRFWVLNELLSQLETSAGMRICLHERDFQVGISIMENIMDNMHKSRSLLLIISKSFIKSRWCQFEMNLAQFLLVEMRDRHVILVFLEHIPKTKRPKLLRYLMATKTYLEWPQVNNNKFTEERNRFFKRLSQALNNHSDKI